MQAEADRHKRAVPDFVTEAAGKGKVESFTVIYKGKGEVEHGVVMMRTEADARALARVPATDAATLEHLLNMDRTPVGTARQGRHGRGRRAGVAGRVASRAGSRPCLRQLTALRPARTVVYELTKHRQAFRPGHDMANRSRTARTTAAARRWVPPAIMTLAAMAALTALTATPRRNRSAQPPSRRRPPRAMPASRSWPLCRSRPSTSRYTIPRVGSCARRFRPEPRDARRRPASLRSSTRKKITTRICMTMPRCRTCSASPGTASRCMAGPCPAMRPPTAACGCRSALPRNCSTRRESECG